LTFSSRGGAILAAVFRMSSSSVNPYQRRSVQMRDQIPELRREQRDLMTRIQTMDFELGKNDYRPSTVVLSEREAVLVDQRVASDTARLRPMIDTADERLTERRRALADIEEQIRVLDADTNDALHSEFAEQQARLMDQRASLGLDQLALQRQMQEIDRWREVRASAQIQARDMQKTVEFHQSVIRALEDEIRATEVEIGRAEKAQKQIDEQLPVIHAVERELSDWSLLVKATSKDGIPALEIDVAGPAVSALINLLLTSCYSSRFTADLRTQRQSADGKKMLEDFELRVIDSERQREGVFDDLSGGERTIVGESLGMAVAIYNKSSHPIATCFRDETTGALDTETAPKYVAMLRRALSLGHFDRILFITHSAECAELADARLRCGSGRVQVCL
jgi:DNA repair exonuclease SbcCD ATPase subunit